MFRKIVSQNANGTLMISIPKAIAEVYNWKKGDNLWIDWVQVAQEHEEITIKTLS